MTVFDALGDPVRRQLLVLLSAGETSVSDLVDALRMVSQPAVSQHLRVLLAAGLVTVRAEGRRRLYALDPAGIAAAQTWLRSLVDPLAGARQPLDALATEVARGRRRGTGGASRNTA
jgi:DNA-binding transcriptional ArsR family regulator